METFIAIAAALGPLLKQVSALVELFATSSQQKLTEEEVAAEIAHILSSTKKKEDDEWDVVRG